MFLVLLFVILLGLRDLENDDYGPSIYQEIFAQRHSEELNLRVPMVGDRSGAVG